MTTAELHRFLSQANNAIVGVNRAGKAPQLTPVWYLWDGETFRFSTTRDRIKYLSLRRDPAIALIVDDGPSHTYVVATGQAEILEDDVAALSRPLIEKYVPADRLQESLQTLGQDPARVIVRLRPDKILVNGAPIGREGEAAA